MATPAAGSEEDDDEFEICNDDGFVFKRRRGLYPDAAPSSAQAAGPDPKAVRLRRRRRALLRLHAKRLRELSRWEALASDLLAPLPAPAPPPPQAPPVSPHRAAAAASSDSVLDDLLAQAEVQEELLKKISQLCDEMDALCDSHEADIVDSIAALPVWGDPQELIKSLCEPDEHTDPGDLDMWQHKQDEGNAGFQRLDNRQSKRVTETGSYNGHKDAAGVSSAAVQRIQNSSEIGKKGPYQCKRCFQFSHTENCCETPVELGNELPPPVLAQNRKRKGAASPSGSISVAAQASNRSKRKKASGSTSTPSGTPGTTTRRKVAYTPITAPETFVSPGPTTRRRAAAQNVSPGGLQ